MTRHSRAEILQLQQQRRTELVEAKKRTANKKQQWQVALEEIKQVELTAEKRIGWRRPNGRNGA